jgi:hypothetical protein
MRMTRSNVLAEEDTAPAPCQGHMGAHAESRLLAVALLRTVLHHDRDAQQGTSEHGYTSSACEGHAIPRPTTHSAGRNWLPQKPIMLAPGLTRRTSPDTHQPRTCRANSTLSISVSGMSSGGLWM